MHYDIRMAYHEQSGNVPIYPKYIDKSGIGFMQGEGDDRTYSLALDIRNCLSNDTQLFYLLVLWTETRLSITESEAINYVFSHDIRTTINAVFESHKWTYSLILVCMDQEQESVIIQNCKPTVFEQLIISIYIYRIKHCFRTGHAIKIGQV